MKKYFACATFYDFVLGGVPTYYLRMFKWAQTNGFECCLYIKNKRQIDYSLKKELEDLFVQIIYFDIGMKGICFDNKDKKIDFLITSDIHCYLHMSEDEYFANTKIIFYVLHPRTTQITRNRFINSFYRKFLRNSLKDRMIFMDEETRDGYIDYYKEKIEINKFFRVGDFIEEYDEQIVENRAIKKNEIFKVLTVARIDFPFKGYVYGLVNNINNIKLDTKVELIVVGDGPDFEQLRDLYSSVLENIRDNISIRLVGSVAYSELPQYYDDASIFVGGGTTLIEACKQGVPSIVSTDHQLGTCCAGYMYEEYDNIGGIIKETQKNVLEMLREVAVMEKNEYCNLSRKCYHSVKELYDINVIMNDIINIETKQLKPCYCLGFLDYLVVKLKELSKKSKRK